MNLRYFVAAIFRPGKTSGKACTVFSIGSTSSASRSRWDLASRWPGTPTCGRPGLRRKVSPGPDRLGSPVATFHSGGRLCAVARRSSENSASCFTSPSWLSCLDLPHPADVAADGTSGTDAMPNERDRIRAPTEPAHLSRIPVVGALDRASAESALPPVPRTMCRLTRALGVSDMSLTQTRGWTRKARSGWGVGDWRQSRRRHPLEIASCYGHVFVRT